jgi:hypothetical protein
VSSGLYAFHNKEKYSVRSEMMGWPLYQINQEYERQQLNASEWRVTHFNKCCALPHLPHQFIVPAAVSDGLSHRLHICVLVDCT